MKLHQLVEASMPATEYGYWIDPLGHVFPVGKHGHEDFVRKQGFNSASAMRQGWIRVTVMNGFQVEAMFSQILPMAKSRLMMLAKHSEATAYYVDSHYYEGDYKSFFYSTLIEFQRGIADLTEETN